MIKQSLILLTINLCMIINAGSNWSSCSKQSSNQDIDDSRGLDSITFDELRQRIKAMQEEFAKKDKKFYMIEKLSESADEIFLSKEFYTIGDETFEPKRLLKNMPYLLNYLDFCINCQKLVFFMSIPEVDLVNLMHFSSGQKKYIGYSTDVPADRKKYAFNIRNINNCVLNTNTNETILLKDIRKRKHMIDFTINADGTMIFSIEKYKQQPNLVIRKKINDEWITQPPVPLKNNSYKNIGYFGDLKALALFTDSSEVEIIPLHVLECR